MQLMFTKMQAAGNDYIYISGRAEAYFAQAPHLAKALCDRHRGIGGDGIVFIEPPQQAGNDARMRIFNRDGSEGKMCGNGIRCVAEWLYREYGFADPRQTLQIETLAGVKKLRRCGPGLWQVEMGCYSTDPGKVGAINMGEGPLVQVPLWAAGRRRKVTCVSMGNPHCVLRGEGLSPVGSSLAAKAVSGHKNFPGGINAEVVRVISPRYLSVFVWERGSGATQSCGTGACAAAAALHAQGICPENEPIFVQMPGGQLTVTVNSDKIVMLTGKTKVCFVGSCEV